MRNRAIMAIALASAVASTGAFADGNTFVNLNAGGSRYNIANPNSGYDNRYSNHSEAGALRVGYRWNSVVDYGVEAGYGYLGRATSNANFGDGSRERLSSKTRGWLLGGNLNYNITDHFYIGARAGWFRAKSIYAAYYQTPDNAVYGRGAATATGEYLGIGGGYNINKAMSIGLAYDTYHVPGNVDYHGTRIGMYSLQAEYRF